MIYEQFIVSIVEVIMLSWQPILLHNFHKMRVTWLFYHFFKLQVHILHSLENIWISNIWKLWLVRCHVIFSGRSLILPKMSKRSEVRRFPFGDSLTQLSSLITRERLDRFQRYTFSSILNALSHEINLFSHCSSSLSTCWSNNFPSKDWQKPNGQAKMNPSQCLMPRSSHPYLRYTGKWPLKYHQNMKKFCLMNIMFLKDKHWYG